MADNRNPEGRTGGTADPKSNPPSGEGPAAKHNPDETRRGDKAGQVSQEGGSTATSRPDTQSGKPGWK